jgi:hypothetical protein
MSINNIVCQVRERLYITIQVILWRALRRFFNITGALAVLLAAGLIVSASLTLAGCGDKDSGDPASPTNPSNPSSGGGGILTLSNDPSYVKVSVYHSSIIPTTVEQFLLAGGSPTAIATNDSSPYTLMSFVSGQTFRGTGTYLVAVSLSSDIYFKGGVHFNNGSATVDFNSMTSFSSLIPEYPEY